MESNGLSEKDFAAFLLRTETFSSSLEKHEGDFAFFSHSGVRDPLSYQCYFLFFLASWSRRNGWCKVFSSIWSAV